MSRPTPEQLTDWDRRYVWHAFTQMAEYEPLIFERGDGCTLVDIHGREYLDGVSSLWCNLHGHRHPALDAAVRQQLGKVAHTTLLGASNSTTIKLAKRLVDLTPDPLNHVFFSDSGATAMEVALKMAFQYWRQCATPRPEKNRFVALTGAYHGDTLGDVSVGGVEQYRRMFGPLLFDVLRVPAPDISRLPEGMGPVDAAAHYLKRVEEVLREHHRSVAAFVIEPLIQGAAGIVMQPEGYLRGVRELTRQYDCLMIADEVAVGMGRTGTLLACQHEQVVPDLLCLAKGLTGGYLPLAATLTSEAVYEAFLGPYAEGKTFFHGHTYGGNPLAAAVALATLDVLEREQSLQHMPTKTKRLASHMEQLAPHPHVRDARCRGLIGRVELVQDKRSDIPYDASLRMGAKVCRAALDQGVWLRPLGDVIVIMPPLVVHLDQLDRIMQAVSHAIDRVTRDDTRDV